MFELLPKMLEPVPEAPPPGGLTDISSPDRLDAADGNSEPDLEGA